MFAWLNLRREESLVESGVRCLRCRCDEEGKLVLRVESDGDHFNSVLSFSFTLGLLRDDCRTASLHLSV